MRRKDREINDNEAILRILDSCTICRLGISVPSGAPYILPMCYGYEVDQGQLNLYFHCAREGRKIELLKNNPLVSFEMDMVQEFCLDDTPCNSSVKYQSIMGCGLVSFVEDHLLEEKAYALDLILQHCAFGTRKACNAYSSNAINATCILKLCVTELTAKGNL